jgi:hypothetical protein
MNYMYICMDVYTYLQSLLRVVEYTRNCLYIYHNINELSSVFKYELQVSGESSIDLMTVIFPTVVNIFYFSSDNFYFQPTGLFLEFKSIMKCLSIQPVYLIRSSTVLKKVYPNNL